ncbi:hypothetical protein QKW52_18780 [Bacillus sonorensis]|nr:hypothetical protein [Bacillus sonorensis]
MGTSMLTILSLGAPPFFKHCPGFIILLAGPGKGAERMASSSEERTHGRRFTVFSDSPEWDAFLTDGLRDSLQQMIKRT